MKQKYINTILGIYFSISLLALFPESDNLIKFCIWETCAIANFLLAQHLCKKFLKTNEHERFNISSGPVQEKQETC